VRCSERAPRCRETWEVALPPLGTATVVFAGSTAARSHRGRRVSGQLRRRARAVSIETSVAVRLVDAVLGGGAVFSAVRAAGPAERGVLAGVLAPVFDRIGGAFTWDRCRRRSPERAGAIAFRWRRRGVRLAAVDGRRRAVCPPPRLDAWAARAGRVPVTGHDRDRGDSRAGGAFAASRLVMRSSSTAPRASAFARRAVGRPASRRAHAADVTIDVDGKLSIGGGFSPLPTRRGT
jgi:hypothetical protein